MPVDGPSAHKPGAPVSGSPFEGCRILIIEDEPLIAMHAEDIIHSLGATSAGMAHSLEAALRRLERVDFHAVLLDVNLKGKLSYEVAETLLKMSIPFMFCTAYSHGFQGFEQVPRLTKPYTFEGLAKALKTILFDNSPRAPVTRD